MAECASQKADPFCEDGAQVKKSLFFGVPVVVALAIYLMVQMSVSNAPARMIDAEVVLVNKCEVPDRYFAVQQVATGRRFRFSGDRVKLKVKEGEQLKLALDSRYDEVEYSGTLFRAAAFQRVTANCSLGERQHGVTDGLRGTFGG